MLATLIGRWRELLTAAGIVSIVVLYNMNAAKGDHIRKQDAVISAQRNMVTIGNNYYSEWKNEQAKNDALTTGINNGTIGLRVKATCPGSTPGMVDGAAAELDATARQDYYTLRAGVTQATNQINGLQAIVREQNKQLELCR